jgi:uncharacterized membrane protein YqgA involved in biofilm formation
MLKEGDDEVLGTVVNTAAIIVGSIFGNFLRGRFPKHIREIIMHALSLIVILIGLSMAIKTQNMLAVTLSMVAGGITGEILKIEDGLKVMGKRLEDRFAKNDGDFTRGFISASLLFCVGAMAIMGSIQSGLTGNHTILFTKSILDGISSFVFSSSMGLGVTFSAVAVFVYQGLITMAAAYIKSFLTDGIVREMSATGGLIIFALGINMLGLDVRIKVGNLLPAIFYAVIFALIISPLPL